MPTRAVHEAPTVPEAPSAASGLVKRVVTGSILAAAVVAATLSVPAPWFALLVAVFFIVGAWEWAGMAGWPTAAQRAAYAGGVAAALLGAAWLLQGTAGTLVLLLVALAWWLTALAWAVRLQQGLTVAALDAPVVRFVAGWLVLVPAWAGVVRLHGAPEAGPPMVLYLLLLIATADTCAYFVGRRFGKRRLASRISPGKSVEGLAGALAAVTVLAVIVGVLTEVASPVGFVALSLVTATVSVLGDLTESVFKRHAGLKDSGSIVPGHGGILDRIDSLTAAAPVFVLGCFLQGSVS
ncbi:MAG: phosphatidate cytidylyltransferase [Gammaproteobacteria bacterium]|nr:phosphatidate cytidylyltransferase [Gammaproteobacteria bacterium]NIM73823.1 phosphatidate cytidylyltransferase [Gammaproteobacteria bacterium]NIN39400.1 phosphatidate cytidylyltransferase [Gammaproteobacteria bacterium]NIO25065.1 phosphatidate cytidylyltransferase [Gammaproteobacteria bacterium]NIO65697.1 phosphatidate cytidylyltransferase [Gammaproteobacteria bacterium]